MHVLFEMKLEWKYIWQRLWEKGVFKSREKVKGLKQQWSLEGSSMVSLQCEQRTSTCSHDTDEQRGQIREVFAVLSGLDFQISTKFLTFAVTSKVTEFHLRVSCDIREHRTEFIGIIVKQIGKTHWI